MNQNSPIAICSHKRSGTHLLAATVEKNFRLPSMSLTTVIHAGKRFVDGERESTVATRAQIPWGGLWASHNFFNPTWIDDVSRILYIVRHPVRTLVSYWRFMDPQCLREEEYLSEARVRFWKKHVTGYTRNCYWIKYENLISSSHDHVLENIAHWFDLDPKNAQFERVKRRVGWYSDKTPLQSKEPPPQLIENCPNVLGTKFLGYNIENPDESLVIEGR